MSINWVMLDDFNNFVKLPRETLLATSPPRVSLSLQTSSSYPGKEPVSIKCSDGKAIITNQRLIYIPTTPTQQLKSLQIPILALNDTHVTAPFFGPNIWEGVFFPTTGGGFPAQHAFIQIKLTFKDGGAFDFQSTFEKIKEQVNHAAEIARENGSQAGSASTGPIDVNLEQLPAYEDIGQTTAVPREMPPSIDTASIAVPIQRPTPISPDGSIRSAPQHSNVHTNINDTTSSGRAVPPSEPPPGYEETQSNTMAGRLEERVAQL